MRKLALKISRKEGGHGAILWFKVSNDVGNLEITLKRDIIDFYQCGQRIEAF
jgi:hypothetical protein